MMRPVFCLVLLAGLASAAAPPAALTAEQVKLLRDRPWFGVGDKTLELELRVYGPWSRQAEKTAERLAQQHAEGQEWTKEAACRRVVLEACRKLDGERHWKTVDARLALAEALAQAKRTPAQRESLQRALARHTQSYNLRWKGQAARALPLCEQALTIRKELLGEGHPDYANSVQNLAFIYSGLGKPKAALPLFEQVIAIRKKSLGVGHPHYGSALNNLAGLYHAMGDHEKALPLLQESLTVFKQTRGEGHPNYVNLLNNLAHLHHGLGNPKAALPLFQRVLELDRKATGGRGLHYASTLNSLALVYEEMGDFKAALPLFQRAREIVKDALEEKHPYYATCLNNLAVLHLRMGDFKAALPLCQQALDIHKELGGEKGESYATALNNLAGLYRAMGDTKKALPLCKRGMEIIRDALGERHPQYATSVHNLASLHRALGDYKVGLPLYQKALAIRKEALGEHHLYYHSTLNHLAALHHARGDHKAALPLSEKATALTLAHLRGCAGVQSDRQQLAAVERFRTRLDVRLSLADTEGYAHVLAWKGAVLMRQRQRRLFSALSANPKTREAAEDLQAVTRQIAALSASERPARERLDALTEAQERLQARLSGLSSEAEAFKASPPTPQALAKALPEGAVLVDYLLYWHHGKAGEPETQRRLVAFVSRRGKPTARIELGPAEKAEEAVRKWRALLTAGKPGKPADAEVKKLLWSPLEKHLTGAKVILVSPDGVLAGMPFAALPGKKDGTYLIEDVALGIVPVPQLLPEMLRPRDDKARLKPSLLVVSDINYDKAGVAPAPAVVGERGAPLGVSRKWGGLPGTRTEANDVKDCFSSLFKGGTITDLREGNASKARVRGALQKVRYAHLATHGFFASEKIKNAAEGTGPTVPFGREGVTGWHPLLLSGVVLAGANREPKEGEEDGILTALEVSEMQLPKLELVILSACETGLGKTAAGEGLLGLQRAFQVAGARTVVASLWEVDDRATQALMSEFYRAAWDTKTIISRAEALRRAQLSILKEGKRRGLAKKGKKLPKGETRLPPLYWAAFVLSGDWR
jgi:CHAT domain-containing protein